MPSLQANTQLFHIQPTEVITYLLIKYFITCMLGDAGKVLVKWKTRGWQR